MEKVGLNRNEVLRYLGYRDQAIDEKMEQQTDRLMDELKDAAAVKYICRTFRIEKGKGSVLIGDGLLELPGSAISRHLEDSEECILMAATLGSNVDKRIRYYGKIDVTKALIFDACATAYIEAVCDELCRKIEAELLEKGWALTFRFSPGYGDVPITLQKQLLMVLDASRRIGLTLTPTMLMTPQKSISGIVGIGRDIVKRTCSGCRRYDNCEYRRNNTVCYQIK